MIRHLLLPTLLLSVITYLSDAQNPVLWGMTEKGGTKDSGIIFNYTVPTGTESNLHSFGIGKDGAYPYGSFIKASNGLLYGTTNEGGAYGNSFGTGGTILSYTATGAYADIHNFGSGYDAIRPAWGKLLQASNGLLYGLSEWGGAYDEGTLFNYTISTGKDSVLYSFNTGGIIGYESGGSLIQVNDSLLLGTTPYGGSNSVGVIFSYNILTGAITKLFDFANDSDGAYPSSLILAYNGLIYGVTSAGGKYGGSYGYGVIFSYNMSTDKETVLHNFSGGTTDGYNAQAPPIQATDSIIYGTTYSGGANNYGTIFSYNISTGVETDVHDFGSNTDGKNPHGTVFQASNGLLYGMTMLGGTNDDGIIYSYNRSTGIETELYDFGNGNDGQNPTGDLIEADTPSIFAAPARATICAGSSVTISVIGAIAYTWAPSAGLSATTGDSVTANPTATTTYTITGTTGSSIYTTTVTVTVIQPSPLIIVPAPVSICSGLSVVLKVISEGSDFEWSPSTGLSATTGDSVIAQPLNSITYTVTGMDSLNCAATDTDAITVIPSPNKPSFKQDGDTLISSSTYDNQWYHDDTLLTNDTGQYLIINALGSYRVVVSNEANGCSTASDSAVIDSTTGVNQLAVESGQLTVYPNPTSNQLTVESGQMEVNEITISNMLGQIVYITPKSPKRDFKKQTIEVSTLPDGLYFITATTNTGTVTQKFIISR